MSDKELLELAALAYGDVEYVADCEAWIETEPGGGHGAWWDPLKDARANTLMLAKLKIDTYYDLRGNDSVSCGAPHHVLCTEPFGLDAAAASRRAGVRAAAEIGKSGSAASGQSKEGPGV